MTKYCCTHQGVGGFGSDVAVFDRLNPNSRLRGKLCLCNTAFSITTQNNKDE